MVKKALFVLLTSSFTKGEQACGTTADCDDGELCNFDNGETGGFCEPCPGDLTDQDCVNARYINDLGTAECKSVCVAEQSEFFNGYFSFNSRVTIRTQCATTQCPRNHSMSSQHCPHFFPWHFVFSERKKIIRK